MILRLTKQFTFDMAHALKGYDGKCQNIHGHTYHLFVTVEGTPLDDPNSPKNGMVTDFGDIKRLVNQVIVEKFDHALVLSKDSPYNLNIPTKTIITDFQPTTENLLLHFSKLLLPHLPEGVKLYSLRLHETETSYAELFL